MSVLDAPYYCNEQIPIPSDLPDVLKEFTKAAIKTQPPDLIRWSAAYFRALALGEQPPISNHLNGTDLIIPQYDGTKLHQELLAIINKQLGPKKIVPLCQIKRKWHDLCMPMDKYHEIVSVGHFDEDEVEWYKFFGLACSAIGKDLEDSIRIIGEILADEAKDKEALISYTVFKHYFEYLAKNDMTQTQIDEILQRIFTTVEREDGMINVHNFMTLGLQSEAIILDD